MFRSYHIMILRLYGNSRCQSVSKRGRRVAPDCRWCLISKRDDLQLLEDGMIQYSTEAGPIGQQGVHDLAVRKDAERSLTTTIAVLGVVAILITAAWVALLGYGAWRLIDWVVG